MGDRPVLELLLPLAGRRISGRTLQPRHHHRQVRLLAAPTRLRRPLGRTRLHL